MKAFHLEILSPSKVFYSGDCQSVTVPFPDGSFGIMAGHTPLTAEIVAGEVTFTVNGTKTVCAVSQGIVCVKRDGVRLFCESALSPDEIDEANERAEAEAARAALRCKQSRRDRLISELAFAKAENNLRVKQHGSIN